MVQVVDMNILRQVSRTLLRFGPDAAHLCRVLSRGFGLTCLVSRISAVKLSLGLKKSSKRKARVLFDISAYFVLEKLNARQLQAVSVPTLDSYKKWAKDAGQDARIDEMGSGARLFWVGSKSVKRVLVYCHGKQYYRVAPN